MPRVWIILQEIFIRSKIILSCLRSSNTTANQIYKKRSTTLKGIRYEGWRKAKGELSFAVCFIFFPAVWEAATRKLIKNTRSEARHKTEHEPRSGRKWMENNSFALCFPSCSNFLRSRGGNESEINKQDGGTARMRESGIHLQLSFSFLLFQQIFCFYCILASPSS